MRTAVVAGFLLLLLVPGAGAAQNAAPITPGTLLRVDAERVGRFHSVGADSLYLALSAGGRTAFALSEIRTLEVRTRPRRIRGAILGYLAGAAVGVGSAVLTEPDNNLAPLRNSVVAVPLGVGLGVALSGSRWKPTSVNRLR